ncbi:MAG: hypothetical protein J6U54_14550 [Clostridiales bacterium]|nr:hypothetical protein [Clostridiales bacterium]
MNNQIKKTAIWVAAILLIFGLFGCQSRTSDETDKTVVESENETPISESEAGFEIQQSQYDVTLDELNSVEYILGYNEDYWIDSQGELWILSDFPDYNTKLYGIHDNGETFLFLRVVDSVYQLNVDWKSYSVFELFVNDFDDDGDTEYELVANRSDNNVEDVFMVEIQSTGEMNIHMFSGDKILEHVKAPFEKLNYKKGESFYWGHYNCFSREKDGMVAVFRFYDDSDDYCEYAVQLIYMKDGNFVVGDSVLATDMPEG